MISILTFLATGFWMLMIFDCVRNDPEKGTWLWILIFLNIPGAVIYFLVRRLPYLNVPLPSTLKRWTHRNQIWEAEAAAKNIGKAHQYITLGNVLADAGQLAQAREAYQQALIREPQNTHALWGMASLELRNAEFETAREKLETLLKQEPDYKFGEASLAYGTVLFELKDWSMARDHLKDDVKRWSHPEASLMLAKIQMQDGDHDTARKTLETMMYKLKASPRFHYRKKQHLVRQAQQMLRVID